jgi:3-deoxy-7-phosphoheptulonate synthase
MSKAALVAGANGIMMEVHNNPDKAYSDGAQSLTIPQFKTLMKHLDRLAEVLKDEELVGV